MVAQIILWYLILIKDSILFFCYVFHYLFISLIEVLLPKREKDVKGQLVLITGAGSGFGRFIALHLADRLCNIAVVDVNKDAAEKTVLEILERGVRAKAYKIDVTNKIQVKTLKEQIKKDLGNVDILINNAAIYDYFPFQESSMEDFERMIELNVTSYIMLTKLFIGDMIKNKRGHIVSISSMQAIYAYSSCVVYAATKFAVNGFMLSLTEYLRAKKLDEFIKTTCIMPSFMNTRSIIHDYRHPESRMGIMEPEWAAEKAIQGILQNKVLFSLPNSLQYLISIVNACPIKIQQYFRDVVIKDKEYKCDRF